MPLVTTTDLTNAKADCDTLTAVATGGLGTTTDRLGGVHKTLAQLAADIEGALPSVLIPGGWVTPTANTNWTAVNGLQYCKDALGFVHIKGGVTASAGATSNMFPLPSGYRPASYSRMFAVTTGSTVVQVYVETNGNVSIGSPTTGTTYNLDPIIFYADGS